MNKIVQISPDDFVDRFSQNMFLMWKFITGIKVNKYNTTGKKKRITKKILYIHRILECELMWINCIKNNPALSYYCYGSDQAWTYDIAEDMQKFGGEIWESMKIIMNHFLKDLAGHKIAEKINEAINRKN